MKAINVPSPVARCRARAVCFLVAAVRRFGSSDQSLSGEGSPTANTKPEARSPKPEARSPKIISSLCHRRVNTVMIRARPSIRITKNHTTLVRLLYAIPSDPSPVITRLQPQLQLCFSHFKYPPFYWLPNPRKCLVLVRILS
jgi:hypothetical protein